MVHKEMKITIIDLVMLYAFMPLLRNYTFRSGLKYYFYFTINY